MLNFQAGGCQIAYKLLRIFKKSQGKKNKDSCPAKIYPLDEEEIVNTTIMRQLWSIIEETSGKTLTGINDSDLINQILTKLSSKQHLSSEDCHVINAYLRSRILLIREMAEYSMVDTPLPLWRVDSSINDSSY